MNVLKIGLIALVMVAATSCSKNKDEVVNTAPVKIGLVTVIEDIANGTLSASPRDGDNAAIIGTKISEKQLLMETTSIVLASRKHGFNDINDSDIRV